MLPIALVSGASAESKNGLAWVIIGGLTKYGEVDFRRYVPK